LNIAGGPASGAQISGQALPGCPKISVEVISGFNLVDSLSTARGVDRFAVQKSPLFMLASIHTSMKASIRCRAGIGSNAWHHLKFGLGLV